MARALYYGAGQRSWTKELDKCTWQTRYIQAVDAAMRWAKASGSSCDYFSLFSPFFRSFGRTNVAYTKSLRGDSRQAAVYWLTAGYQLTAGQLLARLPTCWYF